jgi:signal transduction histidine kinase
VEARRIEAEIGSRAKTEFLAKMTHDLRTPLNAVIGYAEILREDMEAGGGAAPADAARIHDAARRLVGIVDDAVTLSKIETANMRFDAGVIDAVLSNDAPTRRRA